MKLIIQIPCLNEASTLPLVVADLPRQVEGFDSIEYLVIDDGSSDETAEVARQCGVHHVVQHTTNLGLARTFMTGLAHCIALKADVIVNTDGDNQYCGKDIPKLTKPILEDSAGLVIGARPIHSREHFSPLKSALQTIGSWAVRLASDTEVQDAPSGFRAFSVETAKRLVVFNDYTYTLETIIQAGRSGIAIVSVPVSINAKTRESRLFSSTWSYVFRNALVIIRIFAIYQPFRFLGVLGCLLFSAGALVGLRFLWYFINSEGSGHIQSLILASLLIMLGVQAIITAFLADLIAANRKLLEEIRHFTKER